MGVGRRAFADHVDAIVAAVEAAGRPVVLAVHSGAGAPGHEAVDRVPDAIAMMVYVDTGAATGPMDPGFEGVELPLPAAEVLAAEEGYPFLAGLADLRDLTYVDLPTSHWPMWSRPDDLADLLGEIARRS